MTLWVLSFGGGVQRALGLLVLLFTFHETWSYRSLLRAAPVHRRKLCSHSRTGSAVTRINALKEHHPRSLSMATSEKFDVVVIGSGIGGLCSAAILSSYGYSVCVLEAHSQPGGAAHGFKSKVRLPSGELGEFHFDTGPSFFSGLNGGATNPLGDILRYLNESVPCHQYSTFGLSLPEGDFVHTPEFGAKVIRGVSGQEAESAWQKLAVEMKPLATAVEAMPAVALRVDPGVAVTASRFLPTFATIPGGPFTTSQMTKPFSAVLDRVGVKDKFTRNWLDLLCFCLSGLPADGTITAEMAMMFSEFYKPTAVMDYPLGGVKSIVNTLVSSIEKRGGEVRCSSRVEELLFTRTAPSLFDGTLLAGEKGIRVSGVKLESGKEIQASKCVLSSASNWDTSKLVSSSSKKSSTPLPRAVRDWVQHQEEVPACHSFMHLHLGFSLEGLDLSSIQEHYMYLEDWERGVEAEDNAVLISIPSIADSSLAPEGYGCLHAYTPATERWSRWEGIDKKSEEYKRLKEERSAVLWRAVQRVIPDIRSRSVLTLTGTPLTHRRFLNVHRGSYGPALRADLGQSFPAPSTPLRGLVACGDATFPGIGVPAVAASGAIAANSAVGLENLEKHLKFLDAIQSKSE